METKTWPTLYTLDSKRKIRIFNCKVVSALEKLSQQSILDTEIVDSEAYYIITSTGLLSGKQTEQQELVKIGKQKRTIKEQAIFQANSLWERKTEEGYKSIPLLCEKESIGNIGGEGAILNYYRKHPEAAYTNSKWDELPMLAHAVKKVKNLKFPMLGQPKLNGVRGLAKFKTWQDSHYLMQGEVKLISRGGTYYEIIHILSQLGDLSKLLWDNNILRGNYILDGELYKHGIPLQEISGASRKEESGLFTSNNWLEYHIYDVIDLNNINATQEYRRALLFNIESKVKERFPNIKFVQTWAISDIGAVKADHDQCVAEGYEGLMLRDLSSSYKFNERSTGLLKVKEFQDEEFEIVGWEIDESKTIEESFVFVLRNNQGKMSAFGSHSSHTFKARPTGTDEMKRTWYNKCIEHPHSILNKKATIRYFERSKEGVPTMGHLQHKETPCLMECIRPNGQ
jgi:hypothetical protein